MKQLHVYEKYSRHWPAIAIVSAILAIILWGAYMFTGNVLVEGYLRFAAFCFFTLSLLSFLKVKDGRMQINFIVDENGGLKLDYLVRGKNIGHDAFDLNEFEAVDINEMPNRTIYNDFARSDRSVRFKRKESEDWLYLTEVNGRVIPLDKKSAKLAADFLNDFIH